MATRDEEDIVAAMLMGMDVEFSGRLWYVAPANSSPHPIEVANDRATGFSGFRSRGDLARAWIKHTMERCDGTEA
jgi:hypothetical protein